jgi:general secretion pathway protein C
MLGAFAALLLAVAPADLALLGVVWHSDPARSAAILKSEGRQRIVAVGETAFGGHLTAINATSVVLQFGDENVEVRLADESAVAAAPVGRFPVAPRPTPSRVSGRVMARAEVERRLGQEIPRILAETTLVPAREPGGRVAGFTLSRVADNSLLTDAGLRPGDVLTEVNGTPIDSVATLAALYARLANEKELRAVVLRDGQPVPLSITLR